MNYSPTASILSRHIDSADSRHRLVAIDHETLRCLDCCHTLLLKPNKDILDPAMGQPATHAEPAPEQKRDAFGRLPCHRCGRKVSHIRSDGIDEPVPHVSQLGVPCLEPGAMTATLPPGGWRALVPTFKEPGQ